MSEFSNNGGNHKGGNTDENSENTSIGHGVGSTQEYYEKWNAIAGEELEKVEEEGRKQEEHSNTVLGKNNPMSKAEEESISKRKALMEAKKLWEQKQQHEDEITLVVEGEENISLRDIDSSIIENHRVIKIKNCKNSSYRFSNLLSGLIKIFIEDCSGLDLIISCPLITSNIEIVHCEDCSLTISSQIKTIQADLCKNMEVRYIDEGQMQPISTGTSLNESPTKFYWSGCIGLIVKSNSLVCQPPDFVTLADSTGGLIGCQSYEEVQFVIHLVNGVLLTERVIRTSDNLPSTAREMGLEGRSTEEIENSHRDAMLQNTLSEKMKGAEHFKAGEYAQAAIEYTRAIESGKLHEYDGMHLLYANRAFCFSKLGQHEKALEDSNQATILDPSYTKGWFRKGISLHALGRYREACPALGKALDLEPKNKQIKDALRFAEHRASSQR